MICNYHAVNSLLFAFRTIARCSDNETMDVGAHLGGPPTFNIFLNSGFRPPHLPCRELFSHRAPQSSNREARAISVSMSVSDFPIKIG